MAARITASDARYGRARSTTSVIVSSPQRLTSQRVNVTPFASFFTFGSARTPNRCETLARLRVRCGEAGAARRPRQESKSQRRWDEVRLETQISGMAPGGTTE